MCERKKILIISLETWRDDQNGGNVLTNIFKDTGYEFAQIFCSAGTPQNALCQQYFQITHKMIIKGIFTRQAGEAFELEVYPSATQEPVPEEKVDANTVEVCNQKLFGSLKKIRLQSFYAAEELLWWLSNWKSSELKQFVKEFGPDIIFAPWYAKHHMLAIDRYVYQLTKKPVISYVSDDNYSLKQFHLSPVFWVNRFLLRKHTRETVQFYKLVYTMTAEQKKEYEEKLGCKMKILCKGGKFAEKYKDKEIEEPLKIIYAGGVYLNRWKVLKAVAMALRIINQNGKKMELHIYTGGALQPQVKKVLDDGNNSYVHNTVTLEKLKEKYQSSAIALHVEAFDLRNRCATRLSFSTKIVDCLESGCAVMAICPSGQAGYEYLKREDAAICISECSVKKIEENLTRFIENRELLKEYARKAWECGRRNHNHDAVRDMIQSDIDEICAYEY